MNNANKLGYVVFIVLIIGCIAVFGYSQTNTQQSQEKTKEQIDALIEEAGSINPDWWDSVELNIPETLDVNWPVMTRGRGARGERGTQRGAPGQQPGQRGQQPFPPQRGGAPGEVGQRGERGGFGERGGQGFQQGPPTNVDQYVNNVLNTNPSRFREGIKLVDHLMNMHKDDEQKLQRSLNMLAQMYYDLLYDYARAAYYWNESIENGGNADMAKLADCYYELGSKEMAIEAISQQETNQQRLNRGIVRLLAKMGDIDKALEMIEANTNEGDTRRQGENYLLTAEVYRQAGRYDEAIEYYQKVIDIPEETPEQSSEQEAQPAPPRRRGPEGEDVKVRANANMETVKLLSNLDISRIPDGTYTATAMGRNGELNIDITISEGEIESLEVTENTETPNYLARAQKITRNIVSKQDFKGVDAITGATISADAIMNAAVKALVAAME